MESFIVRVYRRSRANPGEIAGLVETVGADEKRAFQSFAGLITALKHAVLSVDSSLAPPAEQIKYTSPDKKQAG